MVTTFWPSDRPKYCLDKDFNLWPNFMNWTDVSLTTSCNSLNLVPDILYIFDFLKSVLTSTAFLKKNMVDCGQLIIYNYVCVKQTYKILRIEFSGSYFLIQQQWVKKRNRKSIFWKIKESVVVAYSNLMKTTFDCNVDLYQVAVKHMDIHINIEVKRSC